MIQGTYEGTDADEYGTSGPQLSFDDANYTSNNGDIGVNGNAWSYTPKVETNSDQFTVTVTDSQGNETNQVINLSFYHVDTEATFEASEVTIHGSEDSNLSGNITIKDTDGLTKLTIEEVEPDITDLTLKSCRRYKR